LVETLDDVLHPLLDKIPLISFDRRVTRMRHLIAPIEEYAREDLNALDTHNEIQSSLVGERNDVLIMDAMNLVTLFRGTPHHQQFLDALPTSVDRFLALDGNAPPLPLDLDRRFGNEVEIPEGGGGSGGELSALSDVALPGNFGDLLLADPQINQGTLGIADVGGVDLSSSESFGSGRSKIIRRRTPPANVEMMEVDSKNDNDDDAGNDKQEEEADE
jgi:hypothetical protein